MEPRAPLPPSAAAPPGIGPPGETPQAAPLPAIIALSEDHTLLQTVSVAVTEQAAVVSAPSPDRFVDQLVANGAEVALIDAALAPSPIAGFLLGLRRQFPQLRVLVVGAAQLHEELRGRIADGTVFRFAHKPASGERLKLLLLAALRTRPVEAPSPPSLGRAGGRGDIAGDTAYADYADEDAVTPLDAAESPRPRWLWPLLLSLTALVAMVAGWYASSFARQRHLLP